MVIIPYIVLAAVAALFFAVSYFIICGFPMKRRKAEEMENGEEEKKGLPDLEKEKKPPVHKAAPVDDATRIIPVKPRREAPVVTLSSPKTISSATRPPYRLARRLSSSVLL